MPLLHKLERSIISTATPIIFSRNEAESKYDHTMRVWHERRVRCIFLRWSRWKIWVDKSQWEQSLVAHISWGEAEESYDKTGLFRRLLKCVGAEYSVDKLGFLYILFWDWLSVHMRRVFFVLRSEKEPFLCITDADEVRIVPCPSALLLSRLFALPIRHLLPF